MFLAATQFNWGYLLTSNHLQKQVDTIRAQYVAHANF